MSVAVPYVDTSWTLELLKDLIRIDSVNPSLVRGGKGELAISEFIAKRLDEIGLETEMMEVEKGRPNVVGILRGEGGGSSLMLNGHTDTVGVDGMEIDPFDPVVKEGRIYGRGAADMKNGLAAMMAATKAIVDSKVKLKGDLIVAGVADEEYASLGTERLVKDLKTDAAIVCEPTDLAVGIAHKGFVWLAITVHGKAAHGSRPELGVDAIFKMRKVMDGVENFQQRVFSKMSHALLGRPTLHASTIEGGKGLSTYPDFCKLQLEIRTIPGISGSELTQQFNEMLTNISMEDRQFKGELTPMFERGPFEIAPDTKIVQTLRSSISKVLGMETPYIGMSGWLDSEIICKAGMPVAIFGPGGVGEHAAIEYAEVDQLGAATKVLASSIEDFCG